jgi:CheY-like chemotaxis protein
MERPNSAFIVLMADDDDDDCLLVESAFQEMGNSLGIVHDLHFVGDGRELLDYLLNAGDFADREKHPRPHLILLDLNMPRIDGREALGRIKSDPRLKSIPVLILTTSKEPRDIALSKQAGASSFLAKPEMFEDLINMLKKFSLAVLQNPNIPFQVVGC